MKAQIIAFFFGCCLAAIAGPPAPRRPVPSLGRPALDETAVRFFGPFNFMSPVQAGQSRCDTLLLSALRFCPRRGMRCALGMVMFNKPENMNAPNGSLSVVVTG